MYFGVLIGTKESHLSPLPFGIWGNGISFGLGNTTYRDSSHTRGDSSQGQGDGALTGKASSGAVSGWQVDSNGVGG